MSACQLSVVIRVADFISDPDASRSVRIPSGPQTKPLKKGFFIGTLQTSISHLPSPILHLPLLISKPNLLWIEIYLYTMLKIGVLGVGHLGKFHLNNWKEIAGAELVGFYDPNDDQAAAVEASHGLKRYPDPASLIQACDAVDIVAPTDHHFHLCEEAIRAGKHVFVEKPITETPEQARTLVKLAQESGIKFQVGHVERFNPAFTAVKDLGLQPLFIEVHRLAQFNPRGTEVSVILDLMIHDIDIILSLVKSDVRAISASGVAVLTDTPDIANARIEFHNGCVANLTSSRISMKKMRKMRLFQKDAYIGIDFLEKKAELIQMDNGSDPNAFTFEIPTHQGNKTIAIRNPSVQDHNAIREELIAFKHSIEQNTRPVVNEMDGLLALDVAHRILERIEQNGINP